MRVVHVVDKIKIGGAEKLLAILAGEIGSHDVELSIVGLDVTSPKFAEELRSYGIEVIIFKAPRLYSIRRFIKLYRYFATRQFDVVHTHLTYSNILGTIAGRLAGAKVVNSIHNTVVKRQRVHHLEQRVVRWLSHRVIAVGYVVEEIHRPWLGSKQVTVIQNAGPTIPPLSDAEREQVRQELAGDPRRTLLIAVARFARQKAIPELIKNFAEIHKRQPEAFLVVVGAGAEFERAVTVVADLALQDHVNLTGLRHDVPRLLAASDLYVSVSLWEGLPVALLEAMMAGLPSVTTRVGDGPNVVAEDTGILVPPEEPEEFVEAVCTLLADSKSLADMGQAARQHAQKHFSAARWVQKLVTLYSELLAGAKQSGG